MKKYLLFEKIFYFHVAFISHYELMSVFFQSLTKSFTISIFFFNFP